MKKIKIAALSLFILLTQQAVARAKIDLKSSRCSFSREVVGEDVKFEIRAGSVQANFSLAKSLFPMSKGEFVTVLENSTVKIRFEDDILTYLKTYGHGEYGKTIDEKKIVEIDKNLTKPDVIEAYLNIHYLPGVSYNSINCEF